MCSFRPDTVFTVYTDDERPRKTVGPRYDLEKSLYRIGLGVFSDGLVRVQIYKSKFYSRFTF